LRKTIESINKQTFKNFEVWVIDGGSSQETQSYLRNLNPPFQFLSEKDSGIYEAMNKGIYLSKAEWLYFLGSGDCLENNLVLERVSIYFSSSIKIVFGNIRYEHQHFETSFSGLLWIKNSMHHQAIFYQKTIFEKYQFATKYQILSDYELNLKMYLEKIPFKKIDNMIAFCEDFGISKKKYWSLYKEEITIKTSLSAVALYPFFLILGIFKFLLKKI
jgi:putative colanic acid biosynthesis glycosyltransferase